MGDEGSVLPLSPGVHLIDAEKKQKPFKVLSHVLRHGSRKSSRRNKDSMEGSPVTPKVRRGTSPGQPVILAVSSPLTSDGSEVSSSVSDGRHVDSTGIRTRHSLPVLPMLPVRGVLDNGHVNNNLVPISSRLDEEEATPMNGGDTETTPQASVDAVSTSVNNQMWDDVDVDVDVSMSALRNLDATIHQLRLHLNQMQKERQNSVASYLISLDKQRQADTEDDPTDTDNQPEEPVHRIRTSFQENDRQSKHNVHELQERLMRLERMRTHVHLHGVPRGQLEKEHLKWLSRMTAHNRTPGKRRDTMPPLKTSSYQSAAAILSGHRPSVVGHLPSHNHTSESVEWHLSDGEVNSNYNSPKLHSLSPKHSGVDVVNPGVPFSLPAVDLHVGETSPLTTVLERPPRHLTPASATSKESSDFPSFSVEKYGKKRNSGTSVASSSLSSQNVTAGVECGLTMSSPLNQTQTGGGNAALSWQCGALEEVQSLRNQVLTSRMNYNRLSEQLVNVQQESDGARLDLNHRLQEVSDKIDSADSRMEELHKAAQGHINDLNTRLRGVEQRYELRLLSLSRKLEDQVESVKARLERVRGEVTGLSAEHYHRDSRAAPVLRRWWRGAGAGDNDGSAAPALLHDHLLSSLLHLGAFLAILLTSTVNLMLKAINSTASFCQHSFGSAVVLVALSGLAGLMWWFRLWLQDADNTHGAKLPLSLAPLWASLCTSVRLLLFPGTSTTTQADNPQ